MPARAVRRGWISSTYSSTSPAAWSDRTSSPLPSTVITPSTSRLSAATVVLASPGRRVERGWPRPVAASREATYFRWFTRASVNGLGSGTDVQ